jgi:hypothetical protein
MHEVLAKPEYNNYLKRKKQRGEKPLPRDQWEAKIFGKDTVERNEPAQEGGQGLRLFKTKAEQQEFVDQIDRVVPTGYASNNMTIALENGLPAKALVNAEAFKKHLDNVSGQFWDYRSEEDPEKKKAMEKALRKTYPRAFDSKGKYKDNMGSLSWNSHDKNTTTNVFNTVRSFLKKNRPELNKAVNKTALLHEVSGLVRVASTILKSLR